jgi:peptidoglycan/LPS O-acetylase OafA/YrhL
VLVLGDKFGFSPDIGALPRALASVGAGLLVAAPLCLQWRENRCWRWLDNRPMDWVGRHSYSIYLLHTGLAIEVTKLVDRAGSYQAAFLVWLAALTPVLLLASSISYRLFEAPFLRRRRPWRA